MCGGAAALLKNPDKLYLGSTRGAFAPNVLFVGNQTKSRMNARFFRK
jgi:hypothetical protein